jgi:hypothetical protein
MTNYSLDVLKGYDMKDIFLKNVSLETGEYQWPNCGVQISGDTSFEIHCTRKLTIFKNKAKKS